MKGIHRIIAFAGILSLVIFLTPAPTFAQGSGSCGDDVGPVVKADQDCCGTCGSQETCCGKCEGEACCGKCGGQAARCTGSADCSCPSCSRGPSQDMAAAFANCEICSSFMENHADLMMACDYNVTDWSEGLVFTMNLKDLTLMDRFRALQEQDKKNGEKYLKLPGKECSERLCPLCAQYFDLRRNGMTEENIDTPTGAIAITRTANPTTLKKAHAWADQMRQMMASFDPSQFAHEGHGHGDPGQATGARKAPEMSAEMMEEFKNCALCSMYLENPEMMTAAQPKIIMMKDGFALCNTVLDQTQVKSYQAFQKRFHDKVDVLMKEPWKESSNKVCTICRQFGELHEAGASMEWSDTPTGTLSIVISEKPDLRNRIHSLGKQLLSFMEM